MKISVWSVMRHAVNGLMFPLVLLLILAIVGASSSWAQERLATGAGVRIERFTAPGGQQRRQATFRFNRPMVPFGDSRQLSTPFTLDCPVSGQGRWVDDRNWVYDFDHALPAGLKCGFTRDAGLHAVDGEPIEGERWFEFTTGEPVLTVLDSDRMVAEDHVFLLGGLARLDRESVQQHLFCDIPGIGEEVGVRLITGEALHSLVKLSYPFKNYYEREFSSGGLGGFFTPGLSENATREQQVLAMAKQGDAPFVAVQCTQRFPGDTTVGLVIKAGIRSVAGVSTSQPQRVEFKVRKGFTAEFDCPRSNLDAQCMPILPMNLRFSTPIALSDAQKILLKSKTGHESYRPKFDEDDKGWVSFVTFPGPFPVDQEFSLELPPGLTDDAGRPLLDGDRFPLTVRTDSTPPLAKFAASFGFLEARGGAALPVTLRNLESLLPLDAAHPGSDADESAAPGSGTTLNRYWEGFRERYWPKSAQIRGHWLRMEDPVAFLRWMERRAIVTAPWFGKDENKQDEVTLKSGEQSVFDTPLLENRALLELFELPRQGSGKTFEVVGIPLPKPGLYVVELASDRLGAYLHGEPKPYYVPATVVVTNLAVHFKRGRDSSLVWVTSLDQGKPVADAQVTIGDCAGNRFFEGRTDRQGILSVPGHLPDAEGLPDCGAAQGKSYLVTARLGEDLSFDLSNWGEGLSVWDFNLGYNAWGERDFANARFATVFDRTLFRAGETVSMKHFARQAVERGLDLPDKKRLNKACMIRHFGSGRVYATLPLQWDEKGTALNRWTIPAEAKGGTYEVILTEAGEKNGQEIPTGQFRVESFRVPVIRGSIAPKADTSPASAEVSLDLQASFFSGGAAGHLPVKVRAMLQPKVLEFDGYPGFEIANGPLSKGSRGSGGGEGEESEGEISGERDAVKKMLPVHSLVLDGSGSGRVELQDLPRTETPQTLLAEMEFLDANGDRQTHSTRITRLPSKVLLGIFSDRRMDSPRQLGFQVVAMDGAGKPQAGVKVAVELFERKLYSHRKRLIGGFYEYEHHRENKSFGEICSGVTDARGRLFCNHESPVKGSLALQAKAVDGDGQPSFAHSFVWLTESDSQWFESVQNNRMDLVPEKPEYDPGEEAVIQVRMPFREATGLITVEREGVLEAFTHPLSGENPLIRVPMKDHFGPNVFISVMAVRGRVTGTAPTALLDLGKPAFRVGYTQLKVGWKGYALGVKVTTDKPVYPVREQAAVLIAVTPPPGRALPPDAEVAVAVVDEGLLELKPNDSWNLLSAMMFKRSLHTETSTAQQHVIGRRHFGRKAGHPGGGGGRHPARQLFDTLLLWEGRVPLDAKGEARVTVPINDQLSSFKVVAVASAGTDLFGTGETTFRTGQDLILTPALPDLVRERDRFQAGFHVRNSSDRPMTVEVRALPSVMVPGNGPETETKGPELPAVTLNLAPGSSDLAIWEMEVPLEAAGLRWSVTATAPEASDRLITTQRVRPVHPTEVIQATLQSLTGEMALPVSVPADALPGKGGIRLLLQDRLTGDLDGVREYMRQYPFTCLEQRVSKAVAMQDAESWNKVMAALPGHLDPDGLARFFPGSSPGSDSLTAYLLTIAHASGLIIPEESRTKMVDGLQRFVEGKILRRSVMPAADLNLRKLSALEAISRYRRVPVALATPLVGSVEQWPASALIDWVNLLTRTPEFPKQKQRLAEGLKALRSRLHFQGTSMTLSSESMDHLWWLMVSPETNLNRLLLTVAEDPAWREDLPRMVRGILSRQVRGHWATTPANAWGVVALQSFAKRFESNAVAGSSRGELAGESQALAWRDHPHGGTLELPWPADGGQAELKVTHQGEGNPWLTVQSRAAVPLQTPLASGYRLTRTVTPILRRNEGVWSSGDLLRIRLKIDATTDMSWVAVSDPLPAGSVILGSGLGNDSAILDAGRKKSGWGGAPSFEERTPEAYRAYFEWLPKGEWALEYTLRLNHAGRFLLPAARVEAMYAPDLFGALPLEPMIVVP
ncbi:MAG: MG2 domain-containing protein [Magnetococcus sp. YQC-9]